MFPVARAGSERQGPENDNADADSEQNDGSAHGAIPDAQMRNDRSSEVKNGADASCDSDGPPDQTGEQASCGGEFESGEQWCRRGCFHNLQDGHLVRIFADLADC